MRFHFGNNHGSGGVLVSSHPSHLVVVDAHPTADPYLDSCIDRPAAAGPDTAAGMKTKNRKQQPQLEKHHPVNPAGEEEGVTQLNVGNQESERPRHRPFFRLGRRDRSQRTSSDEEHKSLSPPPRRRRSPKGGRKMLRRPTMKRSVSLPHDLKVASEHSTEAMRHSCPVSSAVPKPSHRRHVTFSSVQIREYSRILGDHPCCPSGPPLALGWETEREDSVSLDEYELQRDPLRRSKEDFRLGCQDRRTILENLIVSPSSSDSECDSSAAGCCMYSRAEIRKAERRLNRERGENARAVRKMNHRFFRPVGEDQIELKPQDEKTGE